MQTSRVPQRIRAIYLYDVCCYILLHSTGWLVLITRSLVAHLSRRRVVTSVAVVATAKWRIGFVAHLTMLSRPRGPLLPSDTLATEPFCWFCHSLVTRRRDCQSRQGRPHPKLGQVTRQDLLVDLSSSAVPFARRSPSVTAQLTPQWRYSLFQNHLC